MAWVIRGLIEGFYGRPWTWEERLDVLASCGANGMTHYVYAPKDDPKHRVAWREPYTDEELDGFRRLVDQTDMTIGFGISPGLDVDLDGADDLAALAAKVDQATGCGIGLVVLALDDLPTSGVDPARRGAEHARLTNWLVGHLSGRAGVALVPTDYAGAQPSPYLDALAEAVPLDVPIGWTGVNVVNDQITGDEAAARADALGGRPPLLWDNYPVNDAVMTDRLFLGPLRGRDPALAEICSGYLANAMVQPRCSTLPLASTAAYLRGDDPEAAWAAAAGSLLPLAEACDGAVPYELAARLQAEIDGPGWWPAADALSAWLDRAHASAAGELDGLTGEADDWARQVRREVRVAQSALRMLCALRVSGSVDASGHGHVVRPDADVVAGEAFALTVRWPAVRRSAITVLGPRCAFRPVVGQWPDGSWRFRAEAMDVDGNATDLVVRTAFATLADQRSPDQAAGPIEATAGPDVVPVAADGSFQAPPGATVTLELASMRTDVHPRAPIDLGHPGR